MTFAIALDVVIVALVLYRQRMVRRVWPRLSLRLAGVLAVIGLIELLSYTASRHLSGAVIGVLVLSFVVGAVALGALRAASVRIWRVNNAVLRQGTWLTMGLWALSLALHFGAEWWIHALGGPTGVASASLLLWLGVTYGVQNAVVHRRAEGLLAAGGAIDAHADVVGGPGRGGWSGVMFGGWLPGPGASGSAQPPGSDPNRRPKGPDPLPQRTEAIEAHAEQVPRGDGGGRPSGGSAGSDHR
ncbi:MAG TPA: hypothetical protein VMB82_10565 [Acidimicrobiales bacterium]|nr:hypothetical protein [Acidimicrobiales bacterium]